MNVANVGLLLGQIKPHPTHPVLENLGNFDSGKLVEYGRQTVTAVLIVRLKIYVCSSVFLSTVVPTQVKYDTFKA